MDEFDFYQGTHTGGEIDRDLDFIDGFIEAPAVAPVGLTLVGFVPVAEHSNGRSPTAFAMVEQSVEQNPDESRSHSYIATRKNLYDAWHPLERSAIVKVVFTGISSLPVTRTEMATMAEPYLTEDLELIHADISNPAAQAGDWTITTATRSVTVSGSISGTTDITLYLAKPLHSSLF